ncbi:copper resistance protein B [Pseudoxanthomonas daejeonensis]|uniref:Copper resistance protein CopB n=1 Tax=Pseudoxanthomonas daejeonensis TaxID=266062 RepID=A0ABQ6Z6S8_9GAMM|nr:copper resistance protein B [Pseudoxanthomonas daejeonensis]KAF1694437.1 copper resistance protein CopB [Pseudoxanthomonas daejeonensis]
MSRATLRIAMVLALGAPAFAQAQAGCTAEHAAMGHCTLPASAPVPAAVPAKAPSAQAVDDCTAEHAAMGHCKRPQAGSAAFDANDPACPPEHAAMGHCTPRSPRAQVREQAPREPIPIPTEADRAAAFAPLQHGHAHGGDIHSLVRFNRFEAWDADPGTGQAWEGKAWIGGDVRRLWLRSEGEREHGRTASADLEALYGRGISPWWDFLAGVRHDFNPGPSQTWAAVGVQGMAPYKFEVAATAYLGAGGQSMFTAEIEYELLFTSRLILQPLVEVEFMGRADPERGTGSGLSSVEAGLRLRYEVDRQFAPYVGLAYERTYGGTADHRRGAGEAAHETRWVAGVRWWF